MDSVVKMTERASAESLALRTSFLEGDTSNVLKKRREFVAERLEEIRQRSSDDAGVASGGGEQYGEAPET